jgi:hypothetical protein
MILETGSRFNHACKEKHNTAFKFDPRRWAMEFTVSKDSISKGEELLISYGGSHLDLWTHFRFFCQCGGCKGPFASEEVNFKLKHEELNDPMLTIEGSEKSQSSSEGVSQHDSEETDGSLSASEGTESSENAEEVGENQGGSPLV